MSVCLFVCLSVCSLSPPRSFDRSSPNLVGVCRWTSELPLRGSFSKRSTARRVNGSLSLSTILYMCQPHSTQLQKATLLLLQLIRLKGTFCCIDGWWVGVCRWISELIARWVILLVGINMSKMVGITMSEMIGINMGDLIGFNMSEMVGINMCDMIGINMGVMVWIIVSEMMGINRSEMIEINIGVMIGINRSEMIGINCK